MTISVAGVIPEWTIADRLRKARMTTGLNQQDFAKQTGLSRQSVNNLENGMSTPRRVTVKAWAMATGVPELWLLTGTAPQQGPGGRGEYTARDLNPEPAGFVRPLVRQAIAA